MATYKFTLFGAIQRDDGALIPVALGNVDYQRFLAGGGVAEPADPGNPAIVARRERAESLASAANADAMVDQLRNASPAEIVSWVQNNVVDLASARQTIARLAIAVAYLLRNE